MLAVVAAWRFHAQKDEEHIVLEPLPSRASGRTSHTSTTVNNPVWDSAEPEPAEMVFSVPFAIENGAPSEPVGERRATVVVAAARNSGGEGRSRIVSISNVASAWSKPVQSHQAGRHPGALRSAGPTPRERALANRQVQAKPVSTPASEPRYDEASIGRHADAAVGYTDGAVAACMPSYDLAGGGAAVYSDAPMPNYDVASSSAPAFYAEASPIPGGAVAASMPSYDMAGGGAAVYSGAPMPTYDQASSHPSSHSHVYDPHYHEASGGGISRGARKPSVYLGFTDSVGGGEC